MPGIDGLEAARRIRAAEAERRAAPHADRRARPPTPSPRTATPASPPEWTTSWSSRSTATNLRALLDRGCSGRGTRRLTGPRLACRGSRLSSNRCYEREAGRESRQTGRWPVWDDRTRRADAGRHADQPAQRAAGDIPRCAVTLGRLRLARGAARARRPPRCGRRSGCAIGCSSRRAARRPACAARLARRDSRRLRPALRSSAGDRPCGCRQRAAPDAGGGRHLSAAAPGRGRARTAVSTASANSTSAS